MENTEVMNNSTTNTEDNRFDTVARRFHVGITRMVGRKLTARERIVAKDVSNGAIGLNDIVPKSGDGELTITIGYYLTTHTDNPNAKEGNEKEYDTLIIVGTDKANPDKGEQRFYSGSGSLIASFLDFMDELEEAGEEIPGTEIRVFRKPSTGRKGKDFLTCALV